MSVLNAEDYRIYLLGVPIVDVLMKSSSNSLAFTTKTFGIIHSVWPVNNYYFTKYDSISFGIRKYIKSINQGNYSSKLDCYYDMRSSLLYYNKASIMVPENTQNIFTLLAKVSNQSMTQMDTNWYPMNHEGSPYRARFRWSNLDTIEINKINYQCDHYILLIEKLPGDIIKNQAWDYFTDHIILDNVKRELWIEKDRRRIIKANVTIFGMTLVAEFHDK